MPEKAVRSGCMLAVPCENQHESWGIPCIVQPKLDGVRCRAVIRPDSIKLYGSAGIEITSMPHIVMELFRIRDIQGMASYMEPSLELDGELYIHGVSFAEVSGMARRKAVDIAHLAVEYHVFDMVTTDPQTVRCAKLYNIFTNTSLGEKVKRVRTSWANTPDSVRLWLAQFISEGYEGIIIRHPDANYVRSRVKTMLKMKPRAQDDYPIIGCTEEIDLNGNAKSALGAFICKKDDNVFHVGTGLTRGMREMYWHLRQRLDAGGYSLKVAYQNLTAASGVPYQPVALSVIDPQGEEVQLGVRETER